MARNGTETLNGFLDSGCSVKGEVTFSSSFRVDGKIEGKVIAEAELIVGQRGEVLGDVRVARCLVGGTVRGSITATERVVLHSGAKVWADITAPALVMEDGAFLEGKITTTSPDQARRPVDGKR